MSKVGFIGLGTMGGNFARSVLKAGHELVVHDLRRQYVEPHLAAGAPWADSPRRLAEQCAVVLTSLPGPSEVASVAADLALGRPAGGMVFDLSTNAPAVGAPAACRLRGSRPAFPGRGGSKGAASGRCAIWSGGDRAVSDRHRAVLGAVGEQVRYIGPIGAGSMARGRSRTFGSCPTSCWATATIRRPAHCASPTRTSRWPSSSAMTSGCRCA